MANKYLSLVLGKITENELNQTSAGAADAGKGIALDATGKLDASLMPGGLGADVKLLVCSEALSAGDMVQIWDDGGTAKARKADATTGNKFVAVGYVKTGFALGATATVFFSGNLGGLSGLTIGGACFLSETAGGITQTAVNSVGAISQYVGRAVAADELNFMPEQPIQLI